MTTLLNIMSPGHSGSTALNMLLGQLPGFFSAGELLRLPWQLSREEDAPYSTCTCGERLGDCPVWSQVIPPHAYQDPMQSYRLAFLQRQAWGAQAASTWHRLPEIAYRQMAKRGFRTTEISRMLGGTIARRNWDLVDRIGEVTGAGVIIDSTKGLERFHFLNEFRKYRTVVLVRNPQGLAASTIKYGRDPDRIMGAWVVYFERVIEYMENNDVAPIVVRYEDMCNATDLVQTRVARLFPTGAVHCDHHLVAGNASRFRKPFAIKEDQSWKTTLPPDVVGAISAREGSIDRIMTRLYELDTNRPA